VSILPSRSSATRASTNDPAPPLSPSPAKRHLPSFRAAALLAAGLLLCTLPARAAILEEIVAKVNNRIITKSEFEERSQFILRQIYRDHSGADLDKQLKDAQESMLANMITELILIERAQTMLDLDKVRKNLVDDFRKQQKIDSDEDLEKMLKEQGMTRKDLEEQLVRLAVPQEVINYEVKRKISVSEPEIKAYYDLHAKEYETPPTVTLREIVLFYEPVTRDEAGGRAEGVIREFKGGADFADLVQRYSEAGTKEAGGLMEPMKTGDLQPEIAKSAFALGVGEISDPIDTGRSFHIIRVEEKTPRVVKTVEQVHDAIYDAIREEKYRPRYDAYLKKVWRESHVEVMPKYESLLGATPLTQTASQPGSRPGS
jgi:parvulin-like peptidyl-prolyl isomerase